MPAARICLFTGENGSGKKFHLQTGVCLTFDTTIIMPRLVNRSFFINDVNDEEQLRKLLFVGMTRARTWFYLSAVETDKIPLLSIFDEAASQHILTKQVFSDIDITTPVNNQSEDEDVLNIF
jgi:hypothetical protein